MESIFSRDTTARRPPTVHDLIKPEITHLKKSASVRHTSSRPIVASWIFGLALCALLGLYALDPFLYAMHKNEAVRAYLYLHNNGSDSSTKALVDSQILSSGEVAALNGRTGSYKDYYPSTDEAQQQALDIEKYMDDVQTLHDGPYESLDPLGQLRFLLFTRNGISTPTQWSGLNPSVD
jgi:hypothetical protein